MTDDKDYTEAQIEELEKAQAQFNATIDQIKSVVRDMNAKSHLSDSPIESVSLGHNQLHGNIEVHVTARDAVDQMHELADLLGESKVINYNMAKGVFTLHATCGLHELASE